MTDELATFNTPQRDPHLPTIGTYLDLMDQPQKNRAPAARSTSPLKPDLVTTNQLACQTRRQTRLVFVLSKPKGVGMKELLAPQDHYRATQEAGNQVIAMTSTTRSPSHMLTTKARNA